MRPVLIRWRGVHVYSYPTMLYLGLVVGIVAENYAANLAGLDSAAVFIATILLLVPALIGARLLFVATHWSIYRRAPRRIWARTEGGAAMYGGLPFGLLASVPLLGVLGVPLAAFWDVATFTILIGMVFTRLSCLFHGCCGGRPTTGRWALTLPDHRGVRQRRVPTQLLEVGWNLLLLVGAVLLRDRAPFDGFLFLYTVAGYGVGRFALEFTREEYRRAGMLGLPHAISATLIVASVATMLLAMPR